MGHKWPVSTLNIATHKTKHTHTHTHTQKKIPNSHFGNVKLTTNMTQPRFHIFYTDWNHCHPKSRDYIPFFFYTWVFFDKHSQLRGKQGKEEAISLTPLYYFHPLKRHLYISEAFTAESSPQDKASSQTQTRNLWFPSKVSNTITSYLYSV